MTCLIVDDEPAARDILEQYVQKTPGLILLESCSNAHEAYTKIQEYSPQLIFLDISMPRMTGIEFIKRLDDPPNIILTTAYSEYAVESYELNVVDYLLKPFSYDRFLKALKKVSYTENTDQENSEQILIKSDGKWYPCPLKKLDYIESQGDYLKIYLKDKNLITLGTMKQMEQQLSKEQFIRIHKSYIVQLSSIEYIEGNQVSINGKLLPIGKSYRESFFKRFKAN